MVDRKDKAGFFKTPANFRRWLEKNHARSAELVVGFYKLGSGKPSITYPEARDQALCFGWIDGVRKALDHESYTVRFTPRKSKSSWSNVNIGRVETMLKDGLMMAAGLEAYEARSSERSGIYAFENKQQGLDPMFERKFRANKKAWHFFESQAPWYRWTAVYRVMSAKREETREKRLTELISDSEKGLRIKELRRNK